MEENQNIPSEYKILYPKYAHGDNTLYSLGMFWFSSIFSPPFISYIICFFDTFVNRLFHAKREHFWNALFIFSNLPLLRKLLICYLHHLYKLIMKFPLLPWYLLKHIQNLLVQVIAYHKWCIWYGFRLYR